MSTGPATDATAPSSPRGAGPAAAKRTLAAKPAPPAKPLPPAKPAPIPAEVDELAVAAAPADAAKAASPPAQPQGFALRPGRGGNFEYTFDLAKVVADAKAHLEGFEASREGKYTFRQKKHEIDASELSVVAFVQDEATKKILQANYVKVPPAKTGR